MTLFSLWRPHLFRLAGKDGGEKGRCYSETAVTYLLNKGHTSTPHEMPIYCFIPEEPAIVGDDGVGAAEICSSQKGESDANTYYLANFICRTDLLQQFKRNCCQI